MKKKEWIYVIVFGLAIVLAAIFFGDSLNERAEEPVVEDVVVEDVEETPQEYFDLLDEARELVSDQKYNQALSKVDDALEVYQGHQAYVTIAAIHDFTGDYAAQKDALYEVIYTYGILEARYWRNYINALVQIDVDAEMIMAVYEDGISRIEAVADAGGATQLVDMYTGYASYLGGNEMYAEAISYLELARAIDPSRTTIYNQEIQFYQGQI